MSALGAAPSITSLLASSWQPAWGIDAVAALFAGLYAWAAWRVRGRWPRRRTASFLAGLAVVLVALQSGVASYDERLLSVHMVQHMLLLLLAPLLLLEGRPILLALRTLSPAHRAVLARVLGRARTFSHPLAYLPPWK